MKRGLGVLCCLALAALLSPGAASAQACNPPSTTGPDLADPDEVDLVANKGIRQSEEEYRLHGADAQAVAQRRRTLFREAARLHWAWTCRRIKKLPEQPAHQMEVLARGIVFFDLADDRLNMRRWYVVAEGLRQNFGPGLNKLRTLNRQVIELLDIARRRLDGSSGKQVTTWYFTSG